MANGFEISQFVGNLMSIWLQPQNILDIAIVAFVIYELLAVIRKTRAAQLAKGAVVVVAVYALAYILGLRTVMWVMNSVLQVGILALVVLFQPELRRALEQMGRTDKWASKLLRSRRMDPGLRAVCTECALRAGLNSGSGLKMGVDLAAGPDSTVMMRPADGRDH